MTHMLQPTGNGREGENIDNLTRTVENPDNSNLTDLCVSSDADTEKLGSDIINADEDLHPPLSRLVSDRPDLGGVKLETEKDDSMGRALFNRDTMSEVSEVSGLIQNQISTVDQITVPVVLTSGVKEEARVILKDLPQSTNPSPVTFMSNRPRDEVPAIAKPNLSMQDDTEEEEGDDDDDDDEVELEEDELEEDDNDDEDEDILEEVKADVEEDAQTEINNDIYANEEEEEEEENDESKEKMLSPMELEQKRQAAINDIVNIEYQFAELRQRLYENKLVKLEMELKMCLDGSHTELHQYYTKIAEIRDNKLKKAYQRQKYELKCIHKETFATRTMIHQNFYKKVNQLKRQLLSNTTREWYDINKERRDMDTIVPDIHYHVPVKLPGKTLSCITGYAGPAQRLLPGEPISEDLQCENIQYQYKYNPVDKLEVIVDRMRLNNQISDMMGIAKYFHAFPGAPQLNPLRDSEISNDLELIHGNKW